MEGAANADDNNEKKMIFSTSSTWDLWYFFNLTIIANFIS
jgi:hypothetical protein